MSAPTEQLKRRVYNVTAMSFTPEELVDKIAKIVPELRVSYKPDSRQAIGENYIEFSINFFKIFFLLFFSVADSWPQVFDDSEARADWNWKHKYDLDRLVEFMIKDVQENYINPQNNGQS